MKFRVIETLPIVFFILAISSSICYAVIVRPTSQSTKDNDGIKCPNGKENPLNCESTPCSGTQLCYSGGGSGAKLCCDTTGLCPQTGMVTYHNPTPTTGSHSVFEYQYNTDPYFYDWASEHVSYQIACPYPISLFFRKYWVNPVETPDLLAVGFSVDKQEKKLENCVKNSDCVGKNEYCDYPYLGIDKDKTNTTIGYDPENKQFCFVAHRKLPVDIEYYEDPNGVSFVGCNDNNACFKKDPDSFCHLGLTEQPFLTVIKENNTVVEYPGVCLKAKICEAPFKAFDYGGAALQNANKPCSTDHDCDNGGRTNKNPGSFNAKCVTFEKKMQDTASVKDGLCCYQKVNPCKYGTPLTTPSVPCQANNADQAFEQCNGDLLTKNTTSKASLWCDEKEKHCCKDTSTPNSLWLCPDNQTPLFYEPKCKDVKAGDENSGSCQQKHAVCRKGHCCPDATPTKMPKYSYRTNYPCKPGIRPIMIHNGYCDPKTKKVVVYGENTFVEGDKLTALSPQVVCTVDSECPNSKLCIYDQGDKARCYHDPSLPLQPPPNQLWLYVLIASVVLAFVFLCTSIICMVLYRSKSVFDKYKPSKKGGKKGGKKGKKGGKSEKSEAATEGGATTTEGATESKMSTMG